MQKWMVNGIHHHFEQFFGYVVPVSEVRSDKTAR
jgi:hypothetical protein